MSESENTVYAVASGKGGVGKTTTTVNVGTAVAQAGYDVVVVDVDLDMANLAGFVSLGSDVTTLNDVLRGEATVEEATHPLAGSISAVPSGVELEEYADVEATGLREVIAELRDRFDYVFLDVGAGVSHESVLPLGLADGVVLVAVPEPAAVQDVRKTIELVGHTDGQVVGVVMTRTYPDSDADYEAIAARLDVPLLGSVPDDAAVRKSLYAGTPVIIDSPEAPASLAYKRLAGQFMPEDPADVFDLADAGREDAPESVEGVDDTAAESTTTDTATPGPETDEETAEPSGDTDPESTDDSIAVELDLDEAERTDDPGTAAAAPEASDDASPVGDDEPAAESGEPDDGPEPTEAELDLDIPTDADGSESTDDSGADDDSGTEPSTAEVAAGDGAIHEVPSIETERSQGVEGPVEPLDDATEETIREPPAGATGQDDESEDAAGAADGSTEPATGGEGLDTVSVTNVPGEDDDVADADRDGGADGTTSETDTVGEDTSEESDDEDEDGGGLLGRIF